VFYETKYIILKNTYIDTDFSCFNAIVVKEKINENPKCATNTEIVNTAVDSGKVMHGRKKYYNESQRREYKCVGSICNVSVVVNCDHSTEHMECMRRKKFLGFVNL